MNLDRNTNRGGRGKYALALMRKIVPIYEKKERGEILDDDAASILNCFEYLVKHGVVQLGNEDPGQQFFVMKYRDCFTPAALLAYGQAVLQEAEIVKDRSPQQFNELSEYGQVILDEVRKIRVGKIATHIPD